MKSDKALTVTDLFCGAGGFSEGFKQQGFKIQHGVDNWKPAIHTFNHNFNLNCGTIDILEFSKNIELIDALPDTDIIIGSPPCTNFSSSNKCGNADKTMGIQLIETFFKIVAIKKHQRNSKLKAWYMENVTNSRRHILDKYTFRGLGLTDWAKRQNFNPNEIAIDIEGKRMVFNSCEFGVAQSRERLFVGEIVKTQRFPEIINRCNNSPVSVNSIFKNIPNPLKSQKIIADPNYKGIRVEQSFLTDHFYDTGVYEAHWRSAEYYKTNHPYMGKMFFPEEMNNPSRTITATKLAASREAIIYTSESKRLGDGQYRTPTIREIAILMSFPITYQFKGSEATKWRLIGNAVAPLVASAIAKATLQKLKRVIPAKSIVVKTPKLDGITDLKTCTEKIFDAPPTRKAKSRFRRHPFKDGNMTVALSNYCLKENGASDGVWRSTVTYGTGKDYKIQEINARQQERIKKFIEKNCTDGKNFVEEINGDFSKQISNANDLQNMYEKNCSKHKLDPVGLVEKTREIVSNYANGEMIDTQKIFTHKVSVHKRQMYALYAINRISSVANRRK